MARPEISARMPSASSSLRQVAAGLRDVVLALVALLADQALDLLVLARVERREGEVLQLPLDGVDAEPVRERRVDVEGLLGLLDLLLLRHRAERAHVVQPVGELDEDDPDVRGHRDHHLAVVLGLRLVARLERDAGELGDAVDEPGDLLAEDLADLLQRRRRVLDRVVQQRGAQGLGVQAHAGADLRHADGVDDEVLARLAALVGVVLAGEHEGVDHPAAVDLARDLVGVLLDDREQVGEQLALGRRQVRRRLVRGAVLVILVVDGLVRGHGDVRTMAVPVHDGRRRLGRSRLLVVVCHGCRSLPSVAQEGATVRVVQPLLTWICGFSP